MAAQTVTKKRKSAGDSVTATKKVKTAKSADKPAPLKSSLKKPTKESAKKTAAKPAKSVKSKVTKKTKEDGPAAEPVEVPVAAESVAVEPVEEALVEVVEDAEEGGAELTEDQTAALLAGFSSSEDEASDAEDDGIDTGKLPQAPRMKDIQKRIKEATQDDPERTPGVIFIGRIPHGFYEHQMRAYFSQFGEILHIRLARNRKTGKSQHYGFIEFASGAVAEIVAKTMDKYLMFGRLLQVRKVPRDQVKENLWKGGGRRKKPAPRNRLEGAMLKRGMVREDWDKRVGRESKRREEKAEKLKEMGYDFEMPALKSASELPAKPKQIESAEEAGEEDGVKVLQAEPGAEEPETKITRTVQSEPNAVKITEVKTTKKRLSSEGVKKKAKKVKT